MIVAGGVGFVAFLVTSLMGIFGGIQRIDVPGARDLELEAGAHTVYWEIPSAFKPMEGPDGLRVSVRRDGEELPLSGAGLLRTRYSTGSRGGVSIHEFTAPAKGIYVVAATVEVGKTLPAGGVAVSPSLGFSGILKIVLGCLALLGIGVGGGIVLLVRSLKATPLPA